MSKQVKRKITVNLSPKQSKAASAAGAAAAVAAAAAAKTRPSVFERLGTKAGSASKEVACPSWLASGTCAYGKGCTYAATHTLTSPSKRAAAADAAAKRSSKHGGKEQSNAARRLPVGADPLQQQQQQFDAADLDDADPDDLEKRRLELKRELDKQMKMDKAHKKQKKAKKESSPSSESSSSSSESSSSSDESSSSSSSSVETAARRKKVKKTKKRDSSSSSDRELAKKHKPKGVKKPKLQGKLEKTKKVVAKVKVPPKSPTPAKVRKLSQTPPPKTKTLTPVKKLKSESKSPRPPSGSSDKKERHRTPSPKKIENRDKERERKEREREKEKEKEREKERERERERILRDKDKKKEKSPKREARPPSKDVKKKGSPDSSHSRDRKSSPPRTVAPARANLAGGNQRRDPHKSFPPRRYDKRPDSRSKDRDRKDVRKGVSRERERTDRDRERDRERERRIAREEREAAREKEREEALARCQERQRERERIKKLQEKEEEARRAKERARREDRGLDKPTGDRVERLLPLPQDRIPPARKECMEKERHARDRVRRTPDSARSRSRKSAEKPLDQRHYDRGHPVERYEAGRGEHERGDYHLRMRDEHRRDDKRYDPAYERPRDDIRYRELEHGHGQAHPHHAYHDERLNNLDQHRQEYSEERRRRPEAWDEREEIDHRRYREGSRPPVQGGIKGAPREWVENDYEHEWDRRRQLDWEGSLGNSRDGWGDVREREPAADEEWRHYNRSMDSWTADDRRRWENDNNWREGREREPREPREPRPERERPERPERAERGERMERGDRPERPERPDRDRDPPPRDGNREVSRPRSTASQRERTAPPPEPRKELKSDTPGRMGLERSDRLERPERIDRPERVDRPDRSMDRSDSVPPRPDQPPEPKTPAPPEPAAVVVERVESKKEVVKRPADSPPEDATDAKKPCVVEEPLADDLSEISDDADEILNRDEEIAESVEEAAIIEPVDVSSKSGKSEDTQESTAPLPLHPQPSQPVHAPLPKSPATPSISKDSIDENMGMDFEEISEDELEETARMKGLVDALGVDWASLVQESKPRPKPITSAKRRWESHNILVNTGISVELLGKEFALQIFRQHAEALAKPEVDETDKTQESVAKESGSQDGDDADRQVNGMDELSHVVIKSEALDAPSTSTSTVTAIKREEQEGSKADEEKQAVEVTIPHPVAAVQVVMREHAALRKSLFTSAGPFSRALSARRDLAIRRNLCKLPINDTYVEPAKSYNPELYQAACQLFLQRSL